MSSKQKNLALLPFHPFTKKIGLCGKNFYQSGYILAHCPQLQPTDCQRAKSQKAIDESPSHQKGICLEADTLTTADESSFLLKENKTNKSKLVLVEHYRVRSVIQLRYTSFTRVVLLFKSCSRKLLQKYSANADFGRAVLKLKKGPRYP